MARKDSAGEWVHSACHSQRSTQPIKELIPSLTLRGPREASSFQSKSLRGRELWLCHPWLPRRLSCCNSYRFWFPRSRGKWNSKEVSYRCFWDNDMILIELFCTERGDWNCRERNSECSQVLPSNQKCKACGLHIICQCCFFSRETSGNHRWIMLELSRSHQTK